MTDAPALTHADFKRVWLLKREIDHVGQGKARFEGLARITRRWTYLESGTLEMKGQEFAASRRYEWRPMDGGFDIRFEDGKPFHDLWFDRPEAQHFCDPDSYHVSYDFDDWPRWSSTWRVTGPRKDYVMVSRFAPFSARASFEM